MDTEASPVHDALWHGGASRESLAAAAHVSLRTVHRWCAMRAPPGYAVALAEIIGGRLPWPGWERARVHRGLLYVDGSRFGVDAHTLAMAYQAQARIEALERALKEARQPQQHCMCRAFSDGGGFSSE